MAEPLHKFRLHIKNTEFGIKGYFIVQIWGKKHEMLASGGFNSYIAHAVTVLDVTPSGNRSKIITLNFFSKQLKLKYIAHEIKHALFEFSRIYNLDGLNNPRDEELLCELQGELQQQFHRQLIKRKIHDLVIY